METPERCYSNLTCTLGKFERRMRHLTRIIILLGIVLSSLLVTRPALAFPPLPSSFYGTVKVNGANIPDGTIIKALINGQVYAQTQSLTYQGDSFYSLDVQGDDLTTTIIEGGKEGDTVNFVIGEDDSAGQTGIWKSGTIVKLNLSATSNATVAAPQETPTSTPTQATKVIALQDTPVPSETQEATNNENQKVATPIQSGSTPVNTVHVQVTPRPSGTNPSNPTSTVATNPGITRLNPGKYFVTIGIVISICILFIVLWLIFFRKPKV